ncbi:hypothetical protein An15g04070 [Aspergillus niger]|uniref:Uncharacterized protein n=2 Tax=Aspergillus niger TaxID=5061 RepID=A5AC03_ASPNC|nr:hypothetical protein An15g04070 [Aspergillus niger]CAK97275.1 hypothetical protein An15g04070 [Aspergillus niger]
MVRKRETRRAYDLLQLLPGLAAVRSFPRGQPETTPEKRGMDPGWPMIQVMDLISGEFRGSSLPSRNRGYGYESWLYIVGRDISVRETQVMGKFPRGFSDPKPTDPEWIDRRVCGPLEPQCDAWMAEAGQVDNNRPPG